jgi:hypothetical protein
LRTSLTKCLQHTVTGDSDPTILWIHSDENEQKRGISTTAAATKQQIRKAINKELGGGAGKAKQGGRRRPGGVAGAGAAAGRGRVRPGSAKGPRGKGRGGDANGNNANLPKGGLKISFRPAELNRTTDKVVAQQIKAVLGKGKR